MSWFMPHNTSTKSYRFKATLNKSPRVGAPRFAMGCKAQSAAIPVGIASICNAADRLKRGWAGCKGLGSSCLKPINAGRCIVWGGFALILAVAPLIFKSSLSQSMLSQMGVAIIVCLSYNLLLGQGGMLSFGHAVY